MIFLGQQFWVGEAGGIIHVQEKYTKIDSDTSDSLPSRYSQQGATE